MSPDPDKNPSGDLSLSIDNRMRIAVLENDIKWVKQKIESIDRRVWAIVTGVIITILITLLNLVTRVAG